MNNYYNNIKNIINKLKIEKIIGKFIKIKKYGNNYIGFSPFNKENNPSFIISPKKKIWKDFSSGKGGNLIKFFIEYMKLNYYDSIKFLINNFYKKKIFFKKDNNNIDKILNIQEYAKLLYINNLKNNNYIQKILFKRGFNNYIINKFSIGYSNIYNDLTNIILVKKKINKKLIKNCGLFIIKNNNIYDRFRNRIMFPIKNIYGNTIGFGGRIINDNIKYCKYLNSPNNIIYNKSKILYGLFEAKKYIIKYNLCYIVEGYTDVMSLYQNGLKNVISTTGTTINSYQIKIIKKYTKNIILLYDGDKAGQKSSLRNINIFLKENINIKFFYFKNYYDPSSFLLKKKIKNIKKYFLKRSINFLQFRIKLFKKNLNDPFKKYILIKKIIKNINNISNNIIKEIYLQKISKIFNIKINNIIYEKNKIDNKNNNINYLKKKNYNNYYYFNNYNNNNNNNNYLYKKKKINYEKILINNIFYLKKYKYFIFIFKKKKINIKILIKLIFKIINNNNIIFKKKKSINLIKKLIKSIKLKKKKYKKIIKIKNKNFKKKFKNFFLEIILKYKKYLLSKKIKLILKKIKNKKKNKLKKLIKIFLLFKKKKKIEDKLYNL
ncbi:MAG: DNA primase [Candidatus Shikimatogenerans bostrichidophilus]|nr:MAG: DNA primase [Candidatus Shikimatogenerans bostrichidophilus]